jgi:hypothetical protein
MQDNLCRLYQLILEHHTVLNNQWSTVRGSALQKINQNLQFARWRLSSYHHAQRIKLSLELLRPQKHLLRQTLGVTKATGNCDPTMGRIAFRKTLRQWQSSATSASLHNFSP